MLPCQTERRLLQCVRLGELGPGRSTVAEVTRAAGGMGHSLGVAAWTRSTAFRPLCSAGPPHV